jgi:hypothetical protein
MITRTRDSHMITEQKPITLFWHQSGPLMKYDGCTLLIEDLNPESRTRWSMSRSEMLKLGWRCIVAALRG